MNDEHEHAATHAERWLENIRPPAWSVPGDLLGGAGGWVEVVRLDELREAVRKHSTPPAAPSCDWPECALDDDRCAAVAVMGRGTCPRIPPGGESDG